MQAFSSEVFKILVFAQSSVIHIQQQHLPGWPSCNESMHVLGNARTKRQMLLFSSMLNQVETSFEHPHITERATTPPPLAGKIHLDSIHK